jgi:hypothetical protein
VVAVSHRHLQVAALLLHWHPRWRDRIAANDIRGLPLSDEQRHQLLSVDQRAFRADDERIARMVTSLCAELPVAVAMVGVPTLFAMFTDDDVVAAVLPGGSLVDAAGAWLVSHGANAAPIELAIAQARRHLIQPDKGIGTAPGTHAVVVPSGTVARYVQARIALGEDVVAAIARGVRIAPWPESATAAEGVIITPGALGPQLATASISVAQLLHSLDTPCSAKQAIAYARDMGADHDEEAIDLLRELVLEGLLVQGTDTSV